MLNKKNREKGVAMVSAIIVIALLAIMSGAFMEMSYLTYSRKVVERRSTETFYTAEAAIDTIKTAVQNSVASAIPKAEESESAFAAAAYTALTNLVYATDGTLDVTKSSPFYLFLYNKITKDENGKDRTDVDYYKGYMSMDPESPNGPTYIKDGIDPANGGDFTIGSVFIEDETTVRIKDVYIKYVNKQGYVAEIKTDIVVNAPVYASQISVPAGSYSMFAGNGACVSGFQDPGNVIYTHQEGNVYVGYDRSSVGDTITTLSMEGQKAQCYYSIGGTNVVLNGNVYLRNGSTLIFSGGDGTEIANIQINGNIYLKDESTLLLAPNTNLICKGIYVDDDGNGTDDWVPYTGANVKELTISQFYPYAEEDVKDLAGTYYSADFATNKYDISEILKYIADKIKVDKNNKPVKWGNYQSGVGSSNETRTQKVYGTENAYSAVYMLDATFDATNGFTSRLGDEYQLMKCTVTGTGATQTWAWSCNKSGLFNSQIQCRPADENLRLITKVKYKDKLYDREYARIVNIPMLALYADFANSALLDKYYTGYDTNAKSTYSSYVWGNLEENLKSATNYTAILTSILSQFDFDTMNTAAQYAALGMEPGDDPLFGDRIYRVPTKLSDTDKYSSTELTVNTTLKGVGETDTKKFACNNNVTGVGKIAGQGAINNSSDVFCLVVADNKLTVHIPSYYSGVFMTAENVLYSDCGGFSRGISLLELAKKTASNQGIDNANNDVHVILEKLSKCWIANNYNQVSFLQGVWNNGAGELTEAAGFNLFDNMFNGGISTFWSTSQKKVESDNANANGKDFVGTDNWQKNPT